MTEDTDDRIKIIGWIARPEWEALDEWMRARGFKWNNGEREWTRPHQVKVH